MFYEEVNGIGFSFYPYGRMKIKFKSVYKKIFIFPQILAFFVGDRKLESLPEEGMERKQRSLLSDQQYVDLISCQNFNYFSENRQTTIYTTHHKTPDFRHGALIFYY